MTQHKPDSVRTVLFDLDGTLVDTAPDLAAALEKTMHEEGLSPPPYERIRSEASYGGKALVALGFGTDETDARFEQRRQRFLRHYADNLCNDSRLFAGMEDVLNAIEDSERNWGVVTNKPAFLTDPLMQALGLTARAACIVSGDTTARSKPDPLPMLHACTLAGSAGKQCVYVGDAQRDIEAGRRAGMQTLAARFGYLRPDDNPDDWGADKVIELPRDIIQWLREHD